MFAHVCRDIHTVLRQTGYIPLLTTARSTNTIDGLTQECIPQVFCRPKHGTCHVTPTFKLKYLNNDMHSVHVSSVASHPLDVVYNSSVTELENKS